MKPYRIGAGYSGDRIDPAQALAERNRVETDKWERAIREARIEPQ